MRYDVTLRIGYDYTSPTDRARNLLRVLPRDIPGVQVIGDWSLTLGPHPSEQRHFTDFFGNVVTSAVWHGRIDEVRITLNVQAERLSVTPLLALATPLSRLSQELAVVRDISADSPLHFTAASRRAPLDRTMTAFARDRLAPGMSVLDAVRAIGTAIYEEMTYSSDATHVDTEAAEAFAKRAGVCQDFSHIMIACLRGVGIPAAYVSGFLRTLPPPGKEKLVGVDAMHAWVRAWVGPETGWIEFDPTNNQTAGTDYITIGYGRDYDDVAPVRGAMRGAGKQTSEQSVDVVVLDG
ncbi:transglutaminase family protein [Pseudooceanicola batsensis]|nr:transglutaminase family protein [Pseudooceanicola batsensis]